MAADTPSRSDLIGMGAVVAGQLAVGMAIGWFVDSAAETSPIFILVGLAVGIVGAVAYVVSQFRRFLTSPTARPSTSPTASTTNDNDAEGSEN